MNFFFAFSTSILNTFWIISNNIIIKKYFNRQKKCINNLIKNVKITEQLMKKFKQHFVYFRKSHTWAFDFSHILNQQTNRKHTLTKVLFAFRSLKIRIGTYLKKIVSVVSFSYFLLWFKFYFEYFLSNNKNLSMSLTNFRLFN